MGPSAEKKKGTSHPVLLHRFSLSSVSLGTKTLENVPSGVLEFLAGNKKGGFCSRSETPELPLGTKTGEVYELMNKSHLYRSRAEQTSSPQNKNAPQLCEAFGAENETRTLFCMRL